MNVRADLLALRQQVRHLGVRMLRIGEPRAQALDLVSETLIVLDRL